jgi:hypothetical protein
VPLLLAHGFTVGHTLTMTCVPLMDICLATISPKVTLCLLGNCTWST